MYRIYLGERSIVLLSREEKLPNDPECALMRTFEGEDLSMLPFEFENHMNINTLCIVSDNPHKIYDSFRAKVSEHVAAGGLVRDAQGRCLMIMRNGRWDLPKGHLEAGETLEECALREVTEETGVTGNTIERFLCETFHFYHIGREMVLKHTHWYLMQSHGTPQLNPQQEEGISSVEWLDEYDFGRVMETAYPNVLTVLHTAGVI